MKKLIATLLVLLMLTGLSGCTSEEITSYYSFTNESNEFLIFNDFKTGSSDEVEWLGVVYKYSLPSSYDLEPIYSNYDHLYIVDFSDCDDIDITDHSYEVGDVVEGYGTVSKCTEYEGEFVRDAIKGNGKDGKHYHDGELFTGYCEDTSTYYKDGIESNLYYKNIGDLLGNDIIDASTYNSLDEETQKSYMQYDGSIYKYEGLGAVAYSRSSDRTFYVYECSDGQYTFDMTTTEELTVGDDNGYEGITITALLGTLTDCVQVQ